MTAAAFCFNDTATTEIYTLSLHDALPISQTQLHPSVSGDQIAWLDLSAGSDLAGYAASTTLGGSGAPTLGGGGEDRKSTRLNSSHAHITYAVVSLEKKKVSIIGTVNLPSR